MTASTSDVIVKVFFALGREGWGVFGWSYQLFSIFPVLSMFYLAGINVIDVKMFLSVVCKEKKVFWTALVLYSLLSVSVHLALFMYLCMYVFFFFRVVVEQRGD